MTEPSRAELLGAITYLMMFGDPNSNVWALLPCSVCDGSGDDCPACQGRGEVRPKTWAANVASQIIFEATRAAKEVAE